ncbi:MAG: hypothetical protein JXA28_00940 [Bacteroidetes bacterium]|nr:hypothetical protein [Bacteroidota bacterium]
MSLKSTLFGPTSRYDASLPYTYVARVPAIEGDTELHNDYFADTICGLIEYLDTNDISPDDVEIFGLYQDREIPLDKQYCLDTDGCWLTRPQICRSLEEHYRDTLELQYKGHVEDGDCSYDDRERKGSGPY